MKKILCLLSAVLLCVCLASCSKPDTADGAGDKNQTDAVTEKAETTAPEETKADTEPATDWKSEAKKILEPLAETNDTYCLYDANADKVPELIILSGTNAAEMQYSLYDLTKPDKSAISFGSGNSVLGGYEGSALVMMFGKMGEETITKFTYNGEKIESKVLVSREVPVGEDYTSIEKLSFFLAGDESGLGWTKNPAENNAAIISAVEG